MFNGYRVLFPPLKWPKRVTDSTHPPNTKVNSEYSYTPTPHPPPHVPSWHADRQLYLFTTALFTSKYPNLIVTHECNVCVPGYGNIPAFRTNAFGKREMGSKVTAAKNRCYPQVSHTNHDNY